jgi:hypothetical protein
MSEFKQIISCCGCEAFAPFRGFSLALAGSCLVRPNPSKSNQIKPLAKFKVQSCGTMGAMGLADGEKELRNAGWSTSVKPNQTKSNQIKPPPPLVGE